VQSPSRISQESLKTLKFNLRSRAPKRERADIEVVVPTGIELETLKKKDEGKR
jgi:hypothetical protein